MSALTKAERPAKEQAFGGRGDRIMSRTVFCGAVTGIIILVFILGFLEMCIRDSPSAGRPHGRKKFGGALRMMEQFERVNEALDRLEKMLDGMKSENEALGREISELKGIIEDRDLEIMQLQEDAEKLAASSRAEKEELGSRLDGLLGRMCKLTAQELSLIHI